ncbi:MAG: outer membrane beta-barrel protein [Opitutales bacterium]
MKAYLSSPPLASIIPTKVSMLLVALVAIVWPSLSFARLTESSLFGKIDVSATARATYDSNVFSMPSNQFSVHKAASSSLESSGDLILSLTPAAHFTKKIKLIEIHGTVGATGAHFVRNRDKSYVNPITNFSIDFDESLSKRISNNGKIRFDALFDIGQKTETSVLENDLTSYTFYSAGINLRYNHSPKFGVGASTTYSYRDYQSESGVNQYQDITSALIAGRAFYIYSSKLDFFTEYVYSPTRGGRSANKTLDATTHTVSLGAQGDLLSKASGSVRIGYVKKVYANIAFSQDSPSFEADLSWRLNQKTGVSINLEHSFLPSPQDQSIQSTSLGVSLDHRLNERISGDVNLSWSSSEFTTGAGALANNRSLDMFTIGGSVRKQISGHFSGGTGYSFTSASQSVGGNFDRHVLYVEIDGRY